MVERMGRINPDKKSGYRNGAIPQVAQVGPHGGMTLTLGERIAWYRRRRGMTQEVLAGLAGGRTADWLSKVENNRMGIDRLSVLELVADALRIPLARLIERGAVEPRTASHVRELDISRLRDTLADYSHLTADDADTEGIDLDKLGAEIGESWSAYQDSR